jgi:hypothetical protein
LEALYSLYLLEQYLADEREQILEDRRALLQYYSSSMNQYGEFALTFAVAAVGLVGVLLVPGSNKIPVGLFDFIEALAFTFVVPISTSLFTAMYYGKVTANILTRPLLPETPKEDPMDFLRRDYEDHVNRPYRGISAKLTLEISAIVFFVTFLSLIASNLTGTGTSMPLDLTSIAVGAALAIILFLLDHREQNRLTQSQIDEKIAVLFGFAAQLAPPPPLSNPVQRAPARLGYSIDLIALNIKALGRYGQKSFLSEQPEDLKKAVTGVLQGLNNEDAKRIRELYEGLFSWNPLDNPKSNEVAATHST